MTTQRTAAIIEGARTAVIDLLLGAGDYPYTEARNDILDAITRAAENALLPSHDEILDTIYRAVRDANEHAAGIAENASET